LLLKIIVLAVIIEQVWENLQQLAGDKHLNARVKLLGAAVLSVAAALSFRLDFLYVLEIMPEASLPGYILTGFVLSLGSNMVHDLVDIVSGLGAGHKAGGNESLFTNKS